MVVSCLIVHCVVVARVTVTGVRSNVNDRKSSTLAAVLESVPDSDIV